MNSQCFEKCFEARVDLCRRVLVGKNVDYARGGDKLHNFREVAETEGVTMEQAAQGMLVKHWQSVRDMIRDLDRGQHHSMAVWEEKIGDALNYLFLLRGMLEERYTPQQPEYRLLQQGDIIQPGDDYLSPPETWCMIGEDWHGVTYSNFFNPVRRKVSHHG